MGKNDNINNHEGATPGDSLRAPLPAPGHTLIASPLLRDPHFYKSVVMILDSDPAKGCLGLVLNKPSDLTMADLIPGWAGGNEIPVYAGGPVEPSRLFMLHTLGDRFHGSVEIAPGLYVGGRLEDIVTYLHENGLEEGSLRFFLGYSGWSKGQLEAELEEGAWAVQVSPDTSRSLWGEGDAFWRREAGDMGPEGCSWLLMPEPEQLN